MKTVGNEGEREPLQWNSLSVSGIVQINVAGISGLHHICLVTTRVTIARIGPARVTGWGIHSPERTSILRYTWVHRIQVQHLLNPV